MRSILKILNTIDSISKGIGYIMGGVVIILVLLVNFEILMRYVFDSPTMWGTEFQLFVYAGLCMMSLSYSLSRGSHARVEIFLIKLSSRKRNIIEALCYLIFFLPFAYVILKYGIHFALESWAKKETSAWSGWQPPIYHVKTFIPIGAFFLLLQGLAEMTRHILGIFGGKKDD